MNRSMERHLFLIGGKVKTSGGSLSLAKGEAAFVNITKAVQNGAEIVGTFAGQPTDAKKFELRVGISPDRTSNRSRAAKPMSTLPFAISDVKSIRVEGPKTSEAQVDEIILGWDGITPGSEFNFRTNDNTFNIAVEVKGEVISYLGGGSDTEVVAVKIDLPSCDPLETCVDCDGCAPVDCKAITLEAIERLRRKQLVGGTTLSEVVDIYPVFECDNDVTAATTDYTYYTLSVCDTGDDTALALVQSQYTDKVIRIDRVGSTSTYQVLVEDPATPSAYSQSIASVIKGCEDCPAGYTATPGGKLYAFTVEDDGTNQGALVTALAGYVSGTIVKSGNNAGVGFYTAIFSGELSNSTIASFVSSTNGTGTAQFVQDVVEMCSNSTVTTTAWVAGDTCQAVTQTYEIILPDNKCGDDRLAELQSNFPDLTIAIANSASSTRTITLTGSSGTANINVNGTNYLATYGTSLTATAAAFVTTHAADILADEGVTVTSNAAVLTFTGPTAIINALTITNATTNLAGTLGTAAVLPFRQACHTKYTTTVISNLVCEECDPIFKDVYTTSAPGNFDTYAWSLVADNTTQPNGNCKCGIRIKSKIFRISPEEALRGGINFLESSALLNASAGFPEEIREGIGRIPMGSYEAKWLSHRVDRTHLGGNLLNKERESFAYFLGDPYRDNYLENLLTGKTSYIQDLFTQYVGYYIEVQPSNYAGGFGQKFTEGITYVVWAEVGRHTALENLVNNLATAAGKPAVHY